LKTRRRTVEERTYFIVTESDPIFDEAFRELEFSQVEDGYARIFPANSPNIDDIYARFELNVEEMLLQTARIHPVQWEQALLLLLERTQAYPHFNWFLGGSAALAARGLDIMPRDIDLITDDEGAHLLQKLLLDYAIEPLQDSRGWISDWFGRAFVNARVEWVGNVDASVDIPEIADFGPAAALRLETLSWHGYTLRVPPLDLQLQVSERRGLHDRVEKIKQLLSTR